MNKSEMSHETFLTIRNQRFFRERFKTNTSSFRKLFGNLLSANAFANNTEKSFLNFLLDMSETKYYLSSSSDATFILLNRDWKSLVSFRYCATLNEATKRVLGNQAKCIEIVELHSAEKGQGSLIMEDFISLSEGIKLPLALFAETEDLVKYYKRFGFINHGNLGIDNEFLLLRIPPNI
ncbi:hypothetical protein CSV79_01495 [Sporosarcina sp. P13]|uniref:hypothetical protein n=1 Tax=Sporosarcina sp. P13 TaxID=2048263 RepID=UPI000C1669FD|nr:hypothetical protein [Sporosarcina sp. P13]PIC65324.1 hypothetical protein CSV79_01495 [Sporosarcina sp. P13]